VNRSKKSVFIFKTDFSNHLFTDNRPLYILLVEKLPIRYEINGKQTPEVMCSWPSGRSKQASVTVRKCGVITKCTEICIAGNSLNFNFEPHLEGDTHQFTAAPLHNEAMAASIAGESR